MARERLTEEIFERFYIQAQRLWGKEDAEQQRQALQRVAEEIVIVAGYDLPPDLEPRFF